MILYRIACEVPPRIHGSAFVMYHQRQTQSTRPASCGPGAEPCESFRNVLALCSVNQY